MVLFLMASMAFAQKTYTWKEGWNFGINAGPTLFLGDIVSTNSYLPWDHSELTTTFAIRAGKKLIPQVNVYASFFAGKLRGTKYHFNDNKPADLAFRSREYGLALNVRLDIFKLFKFGKNLPVSLYGQIGAGPLFYETIKTRPSDNKILVDYGFVKREPRTTFVVPFGIGFSVDMAKNISFELEANWYKTTTDKLDGHIGSRADNRDDMFNTFMFGITYQIMTSNKKYY